MIDTGERKKQRRKENKWLFVLSVYAGDTLLSLDSLCSACLAVPLHPSVYTSFTWPFRSILQR